MRPEAGLAGKACQHYTALLHTFRRDSQYSAENGQTNHILLDVGKPKPHLQDRPHVQHILIQVWNLLFGVKKIGGSLFMLVSFCWIPVMWLGISYSFCLIFGTIIMRIWKIVKIFTIGTCNFYVLQSLTLLEFRWNTAGNPIFLQGFPTSHPVKIRPSCKNQTFSTSIRKAWKSFGNPNFRGGCPKGNKIVFLNFAPCSLLSGVAVSKRNRMGQWRFSWMIIIVNAISLIAKS